LDGDENGRHVVLTHGFSVPYYIFDKTFGFLCSSGFRVLRYDLFGRGLSDRPKVKYNIDLFVRQLSDLLHALQFGPVSLAGLSMGGPITTAFLVKYPERVRKHVLIDPVGVKPVQLSIILRGVKLPSVGELALGLFGSEGLVKSIASDFFDPAMVEAFQAKYRVQMQFKGFKRAILSTIRNGMLGSCYEIYEQAGQLKKPTLLFWGRHDTTVPFEYSADILTAISHAEFHAIENCGHIPHFEKPEIVNPLLKRFLEA